MQKTDEFFFADRQNALVKYRLSEQRDSLAQWKDKAIAWEKARSTKG